MSSGNRVVNSNAAFLRGFVFYLNSIGKEAYRIPDRFMTGKSIFVPYIFTDGETGAFLAGVKFSIYQGDTLIATMTTDENGVATCDNLDKGTYLVQEDALPEGYFGELVVLDAVVQSDVVTELHTVNCKSKSQIRIIKTDDLTGEAVSGAAFTVTDESGNVFTTITTDERGEAITDWFPYGVYVVTETKTPDHYVTSDWSETVAAYENGVTYTFEVSNTPTKGYL